MLVVALFALLITPCCAFFHVGGAASQLALRSREAWLGTQRPFHVGGWRLARIWGFGRTVAARRATLCIGGRSEGENKEGSDGDFHDIEELGDLEDLARILQEQRGVLDHIDVGAAWACLARVESGHSEREVGEIVAALQDMTRISLGQMDGREIAKVMHSMAQLHEARWVDEKVEGSPDRGLLEALQRQATAMAGQFTPQDVGRLGGGVRIHSENARLSGRHGV